MSQSKFKPVQMNLFDPIYTLSARKLRLLENGWSGYFNRVILPELVKLEPMFEPLYSSNPNSRPSTPTYLVLAMLILKDLFNLTDQELEKNVTFSIEYQFALGTTSFEHQPVNQRTLNRFRAANTLYTEENGIDLLSEFAEKLAKSLENAYLGTNLKRRMDSVMIDNGCRKLSRLQLAHVVIKNMLLVLDENDVEIPEKLHHYIEDFDENKVTYHSKVPAKDKLETACQDACAVRDLIPAEFKDAEEANQLLRFISEQVITNSDGSFNSVRDGKELTSTVLNNPAEPESTFRKKAGKNHQGYVGNFVETVDLDTNRKIIDSMDFQPNIYSDSQFAKDEIQKMAQAGDTTTLVADGAYISVNTINEAAEHGIKLVGTAMTGKETPDLTADFEIDEEAKTITCPNGKSADRVSCYEKTESWYASFHKETTCKDCPFAAAGQCPLKNHKKVRSGTISHKMIQRANLQRTMKSEEAIADFRFRNGVEAIPSQLRRNQKIDFLPFRGLVRKKFGYVLAITAINVRRVLKYAQEDAKKALDLLISELIQALYVNFGPISHTEFNLAFIGVRH